MKHFLCSDIVILNVNAQPRFVNLEEIWRDGAIVDAEEGVEAGAAAEMKAGTANFAAEIRAVESHDFGYRIELAFRNAEWTPAAFTPAHLTDLESIARAQSGLAVRLEKR